MSTTVAILAQSEFATQTASLAPQTVYTPTADSLLEVAIYCQGHGGAVAAMLSYTDDYGSQQIGQNGIPWSDRRFIKAKANTPITVEAEILSGQPTYTIDVLVAGLVTS